MNLPSRKLGFTLMEALISIGVLSLVGVTMVAVVTQCLKVYSDGESGTAAVNSATIAMQRLSNDIRDGRSAVESNGTLTVYYPKKITDATTKESIYDLSAQDATPHTYYLSEGNLVRDVNGTKTIMAKGITKTIAPDGQEVEPFGASGGSISITLTGTAQTGSKTCKQPVVGRIAMRNYKF